MFLPRSINRKIKQKTEEHELEELEEEELLCVAEELQN